MDMKELNKSQLILLAVLLSFVTSIATGITTVTLMQQAPDSFTVPVNRVIKQTVEKIQQVEGKTVTQTVIVKEEDLVVDAIAKNKSSVFAISKDGYDGGVPISLGQGFVINSDGVIVADGALVPSKEDYFVTNESGKFKAEFLFKDNAGFSFLKIGEPVDPIHKVSFTVPAFIDLSKIKIGQKIIILGSTISSFIFDGSKEIKLNVIKSNAGGIVFDLDAGVIGIALSSEITSFVSMDAINTSFTASQPQP
jgi:hypothetical protein